MMTSDKIKAAIKGWCSEEGPLQLVEDRSEAGHDFVLGLRAAAAGTGTVPVDVLLVTGEARVTLRSQVTSAASADEVATLLESRPATVGAEISNAGDPLVTAHVWVDGFSRHTFSTALAEVVKTGELLEGLTGPRTGLLGAKAESLAQPQPQAAQSLPQPSVQPQPEPEPQPQAAQPLPSPSFGGSAGWSTPSGQPAPTAAPASVGFAPTHTVPPQGLQAWAAPDPAGVVVATLGGGLPIQVTEVRGAWAHVLCSNGWRGWVDGRIIGVAR